MRNNMIRLSWIISIGIAIFGVMLIQYFYQFSSETGNLGIVGITIVTPFVLLCLFITFRFFNQLGKQPSDSINRIAYLVFGPLFIAMLIYYENDYKQSVFAKLGGTTSDPQSKIYGMHWLNAETSKIYFNFYTIVILIASVAIISYAIGSFQYKRKKELE